MRKEKFFSTMFLLLFILVDVTSGETEKEYKPISNIAKLEISFADPEWDGITIPIKQICENEEASTPRFIVTNIPAGTNAIITEFSDKDYTPMDNGGHGRIGYRISEGTKKVTIPSIRANTTDLPDRFFLIADSSRFDSKLIKAGAYTPPCSGGVGSLYYATFKAVHKATSKDDISKLLGIGKIDLGRY